MRSKERSCDLKVSSFLTADSVTKLQGFILFFFLQMLASVPTFLDTGFLYVLALALI